MSSVEYGEQTFPQHIILNDDYFEYESESQGVVEVSDVEKESKNVVIFYTGGRESIDTAYSEKGFVRDLAKNFSVCIVSKVIFTRVQKFH